MERVGIDVHQVSTPICVLTETGEYADCRVRTEREALTAFFGEHPRSRILSRLHRGANGGAASGSRFGTRF